ncbi:MAG: type 1 glutamine amidotransferase domain-containing protein [Myxococcota bacterium]
MSGDLNPTFPGRPKRVLIIAANPTVSEQTGFPIGFWWAELTHPYWVFIEAGYDVEIRSPKGGRLEGDKWSDPRDESGYSADDVLSLGFIESQKHRALVENTASIEDVNIDNYDAIFLVGGQSPMYTFYRNEALTNLLVRFYESGKVTAVVCHATCMLLDAKLSSGDLMVKGKTWTGFANSEEIFADEFVGKKIQPFWIEEEARKLTDTNFVVDQQFRHFAVRDGHLITGQQQHSGAAAAQLVVEALGR